MADARTRDAPTPEPCEAADLVLLEGRVHTLAGTAPSDPRDEAPDASAVAVRDGQLVAVGGEDDMAAWIGPRTQVRRLAGRTVLPGFVDAHTHLTLLGWRLVHVDLSAARSPEDCVALLAEGARDDHEWIVGIGYDESAWPSEVRRAPTREDLDRVATTRPVVALREDAHTAVVSSEALRRLGDALPSEDVARAGGQPTGLLVERAVDAVYAALTPDVAETRRVLEAAQAHAAAHGVTAVHDMVRGGHTARVLRELDLADALALRVRLNLWSDHLDAVLETGLRGGHGSPRLRMGAIKTYTDGSLGGRTARLGEPYADGGGTGQWVVAPDALAALAQRVDDAGLQLAIHAIGDAAIEAALDALERHTADPGAARHRIEHLELATDAHLERLGRAGIVASMQPNFLKWAHPGGLYHARLGPARTAWSNRFAAVARAGAPLALGSDTMPLDPGFGLQEVVRAPEPDQRLTVGEALRASTQGGAWAGFDEDRLGALVPGHLADLVVLDRCPWAHPGGLADLGVALTISGGRITHDAS